MAERPVCAAIQTRFHGSTWLVLPAIALLATAAPTHAEHQEFELQPNEEALIDLSGNPQDADDTALRIQNLSGNAGLVTIDFTLAPCVPALPGRRIAAAGAPSVRAGARLSLRPSLLIPASLDIILSRNMCPGKRGVSVPMATCDVDDDGLCDIVDVTIMSRAQMNLGPGLGEACGAAQIP